MKRSFDSPRSGLYIHVPFCASICPYCDFAVARGSEDDRERYTAALLIEIARHADDDWVFDTIYFGGGTPSALTLEQLERILAAARAAFVLDEPRIYLEANPEDVNAESAAEWRSLGVETLSLGVQTFDSADLKWLGRRHRRDTAVESVTTAVAAGFQTVSLDLIYGLPRQEIGAWRSQLDTALGLGVDHLSCYQLTFHEQTPFGRGLQRGLLRELPEHDQANFFTETHRHLNSRGCTAYEVSNFARAPEHRSRHNQKYWDHTPYLGLGPSAHSYRAGRRWWNESRWRLYVERLEGGDPAIDGREQLDRDQLALERVMLGLRTVAGIELEPFREEFGTDLAEVNRRLIECEPLLELTDGRLRCSDQGLVIADTLTLGLTLR